ncbi:MAG: ABC transporter ATP-binding protein [Chitinophagaceae bacterium]|nr:ABC transporter ATP-binding protein [Chitinophagaceae bacterium]
MALLTVNGVSKQERGNFVVKEISFTQMPFEKIAIAGETGSGKTTLLKMIAGLIEPDAGEIQFQHKKIIGPNDQLIPGHPGIVYLSQYFELRNNYWVYDLMEMANKLSEAEANTIYSICQIEHLLKRRTNQLSGGEKQRIALAKLLTTSPKLLLLDEPFSNLDAAHKQTIKSVIHEIGIQLGISCIMVSHDALDVLSWADTILILKDGAVVQQGTPKQIYYQPANEYCAALFGTYNLINVGNKQILAALKGAEADEQQLLIRPEQIKIKTENKTALKGSIAKVLFFGSYYMLDVVIDQQLLHVKTEKGAYAEGEQIYLSIDAADLWLL